MTSRHGFSLVESLIAMAILTITGLGSLKFYRFLELERTNAMLRVQASILANSAISQLQQVNTNFICANGNAIDFEQIDKCGLPLAVDSPFTLSIATKKTLNFALYNGEFIDFAKIIEIFVSWQDRKGQTQQLTLFTTVSIFTNLL